MATTKLPGALHTLITRPQSLSREFPWDRILDEEHIVLNHDGSLGVVFKIELAEHETMTEAEVITLINSLKVFFSFPENIVMQVIYEQLPLSPLDQRFNQYANQNSGGHAVSQFLFKQRLKQLRDACQNGLPEAPFERRGLLTLRWFPQKRRSQKFWSFYSGQNLPLKAEAEQTSKGITEFLAVIRTLEANSPLRLRRLRGEELLSCLRQFFNPETFYHRSFAAFNPAIPLSEQVVYTPPTLNFAGVEREGLKTRTISLKTSPSFAYPGGMAYFTGLGFPMRMTLNFSFPAKGSVKKHLDLKELFLENTPSARARRQKEDLLEVQRRLAHDDRCVQLSFHVTVEAKTDDALDQMTRAVLSAFQNQLEAEAIVEQSIGAALALTSLPLFYDPRSDLSARRYIRILRSDAAKFLPVFDSFRGLNQPVQLYLSR